jgi:hypothetical protein
MADQKDLSEIEQIPSPVKQWLTEREAGDTAPRTLDQIFVGAEHESMRENLREKGYAAFRDNDGGEHFVAATFDDAGRVMDMAAAIPRSAGKAYDFLNEVADFRQLLTDGKQQRKDAVALFHKLYRADGTTNNAVNKLAALISPHGSFKVRGVKGQRGKAGDKAATELQTALNWWRDNVNARDEDSVISGDRGLAAFILQGTRLQLIEGDHIARHLWPKKAVQVPQINKPFTLPMNLQSMSVQHVEIPEGLQGTNTEIMYWRPPASYIAILRNTIDPNLKKYLDKAVPAKVRTELFTKQRFFLDPSLLIHIKHRATPVDVFGVSLVEPTLSEIRYKRALDALELTVVTNLMARAVIIKVGSDNENSVYHRQEVSASRLGLLQRMMRNVGPNPTILWAGPDISVVEVSAHDALLDIVPRYAMAERRHLMALGLPAVLMIGEGGDGKAAGFAAAMGVAAQLSEIQYQYAQAFKSLAERIALENGYEEVDVVWEWHDNLLEDKQAAADLILKLFDRGLVSPETALEETGFDYGAEETRQADAVALGYKDAPFGIPLSAATNNPGGVGSDTSGGGGQGRPPQSTTTNTDPRKMKEKKTPVENK